MLTAIAALLTGVYVLGEKGGDETTSVGLPWAFVGWFATIAALVWFIERERKTDRYSTRYSKRLWLPEASQSFLRAASSLPIMATVPVPVPCVLVLNTDRLCVCTPFRFGVCAGALAQVW